MTFCHMIIFHIADCIWLTKPPQFTIYCAFSERLSFWLHYGLIRIFLCYIYFLLTTNVPFQIQTIIYRDCDCYSRAYFLTKHYPDNKMPACVRPHSRAWCNFIVRSRLIFYTMFANNHNLILKIDINWCHKFKMLSISISIIGRKNERACYSFGINK